MYHMFIVSLMNYLFQRVVPTFQLSNNCLCIITQGNNLGIIIRLARML